MDVEGGWTIQRGDVGDGARGPARVATSPAREGHSVMAAVGALMLRLGLDGDQGGGADGRAGPIRVPGPDIKIGARARAIPSVQRLFHCVEASEAGPVQEIPV